MSKVPFFKDSECCPKILDYTLPEVASNYYSCFEKEYKDLQNDKPWFCRPCKMCVSLLTNNQLIITHDYNKTK